VRKARIPCLVLLANALAFAADAALPYFAHVRNVRPAAAGKQNYLVVDATTWSRARLDLGDLRLFRGEEQVPYALVTKRAEKRTEQAGARLLNKGVVNGQTEFVLEAPVPEYDEIRLRLDARDFVAHATVEGADDLRAPAWTKLGSFTLYDFTREGLGSSSAVRLPSATFRYLRVRIAGPVKPEEVREAVFDDRQEQREAWTALDIRPEIRHQGRETVVRWQQPANVPLERVTLETEDVNFQRSVVLGIADGQRLQTGGVRRVKMTRAGREIDTAELSLRTSLQRAEPQLLELVVDNGDNPPLRLAAVRLEMLERRLYFVPLGSGSLSLYFGDARLTAPEYDFAKLFREEPDAVAATLGALQANASYAGRPDDRPWSERQPALLWTALLLAIAGLAVVAWRALRA
jgi:hypothetical protein